MPMRKRAAASNVILVKKEKRNGGGSNGRRKLAPTPPLQRLKRHAGHHSTSHPPSHLLRTIGLICFPEEQALQTSHRNSAKVFQKTKAVRGSAGG
jgi:hypothetical protein